MKTSIGDYGDWDKNRNPYTNIPPKPWDINPHEPWDKKDKWQKPEIPKVVKRRTSIIHYAVAKIVI